ncbi:MAG: 7TM diverse intracellular signaling domain-containing protein [Campylobacterota bacterium]|nr:7TM diverse intracellular signaling domain-containing protein [Campylobacterota bacterium]
MLSKIVWFIFLAFMLPLSASEVNLFKNSQIYIDKERLSFNEIKQQRFKKMSHEHINLGFQADTSVWIKFSLKNETDTPKEKILKINNPLLEHITLHDQNHSSTEGMLHIHSLRTALYPSFKLKLAPHSHKSYYLHVKNSTTSLQFSVILTDTENFYSNDKRKQFAIILLIGIVIAFLIYSTALYLYTKDASYLYYTLYITAILFQQLTYIGFLPLHMPEWFTAIDNLIVVPKLGIMIITAILFARSFLRTEAFKKIDTTYKILIALSVVQIITLSTPWFYVPETMILTGLFFIFFNFFVALYVYAKGNKQARFFIAGWVFLLIGYFLMILDALGVLSVMYHLQSLVLLCTILEALFLLLAFADRINILQVQKDHYEQNLVKELRQRNIIVEKEVSNRTHTLNTLYRELHHRVKNNLQIILSIIRLQSDRADEAVKEPLLELENRIRSISKTHELLYQNEDIETIDMQEYIESLCEDIEASLSKKDLNFAIDVNANMPLKEAVYIGLIVNELVSNAIKYAPVNSTITITLGHKDSICYNLHVSDDGDGYKHSNTASNSLGLTLVHTLVEDQLGGTIEINHHNTCSYDIRFKA